MTKKIGFGIVGAGMIGKVHAAAINVLPDAEVVAVWGRNVERVNELAANYNAVGYTDYAQFLAHSGLDVVTICSPSGLHLDHGQTAAEAGKHVLMEKPIEINLERADALIDACARAGVQLGVIFQSRFLPTVQKMKAAVEAGKLGRLLLGDAYVKWYRAPEYYNDSWHGTMALDGGGALINQAIHTIDLLRCAPPTPIPEPCGQYRGLNSSSPHGKVNDVRFRRTFCFQVFDCGNSRSAFERCACRARSHTSCGSGIGIARRAFCAWQAR